MSEPTKSPWEVFAGSSENNHCKRIFSENTLIAIVTNSDMVMSEIESNARLIAAAPELYRALDLCLEQLLFSEGGEPLSFRKAIVEAKQALAKARGE